LEPIVIIPTFWTRRRGRGLERSRIHFDHPTPLDSEGTLVECLRSLEPVSGLGRVVLLVATTDESIEHTAEDRVREILEDFPGIDSLVFGAAEVGSLHRRMEQLEFADLIAGASLNGYGGVRNVGLMAAAALGAEQIVFFDDDQVVTSPDFLVRAMEGLGEHTAGGKPILAKSGYYTDDAGSYTVGGSSAWYDAFWKQNELFDKTIAAITKPPRMKPSPLAFGGCLALHRDMYCNVPFDPWAVRGEDIDYVINARMHGGDVYLDGEWFAVHHPPAVPSEATHFRHDVFRFVYTHRKLEFSRSQVDLRQVTADSLAPYPGRLVDSSIGWRARATALLRALGRPERGVYLTIANRAVPDAQRYARENCERYFAFQRRWPMLMDRLWQDIALNSLFTGERSVDRSAITGRFPIIRSE
jgi:GT2 family glycosyltransferase